MWIGYQIIAITISTTITILCAALILTILVAINKSKRRISSLDKITLAPAFSSLICHFICYVISTGWILQPLHPSLCLLHAFFEYIFHGLDVIFYQALTVLRFLLTVAPKYMMKTSDTKQVKLSIFIGSLLTAPTSLAGIPFIAKQVTYNTCLWQPEKYVDLRKFQLTYLFISVPFIVSVCLNLAVLQKHKINQIHVMPTRKKMMNLIDAKITAIIMLLFLVGTYLRLLLFFFNKEQLGSDFGIFMFRISCDLLYLFYSIPFLIYIVFSRAIRNDVKALFKPL